MSYMVWEPIPLKADLRQLDRRERDIVDGQGRRAVWRLTAVQDGLEGTPSLRVNFTKKAETEMLQELGWKTNDAIQFLKVLSAGRYVGSQWCYAPNSTQPWACDVYIMGFNRFTGIENQKCDPWVYFKFGMTGVSFDRLTVFSAHPERK